MKLSVVIPTRNRADTLSNLLESFNQLEDVAFKWEVLVVDNGSTDNTEDVVNNRVRSSRYDLRYVKEGSPGLHNGRHKGAAEARGQILGYLDDDMILAPSWLRGAELIINNHADAVVGPILPRWECEPPAWIMLLLRNGVLGELGLLNMGPEFTRVSGSYIYGGNCFLPRHLVFDLGGFHPDGMPKDQIRFRGDGETGFYSKFEKAGFRGWYDPRAIVYHIVNQERISLDYFCRRSYNQGISDSFTDIKKNANAPVSVPSGATKLSDRIRAALGWRLRTIREAIHHLEIKYTGPPAPVNENNASEWVFPATEWDDKKKLIHNAKLNGYQYHQNEVAHDPALRQWVLQKEYFSTISESQQ